MPSGKPGDTLTEARCSEDRGTSSSANVMSPVATPRYEWSRLPWKQIQRRTFKLQKRIYHASQRGDARAVHRLQRLLMTSRSAKCLAVRRVTQDNTGKHLADRDVIRSRWSRW